MLCCNSAMAGMDPAKYAHSPVHRAVLARDYATLRRILSSIPRISQPCKSLSEAESMAEEEKAEVISSVIDRRDVPKRETPLHLAVKLADVTAVEILMAAGADSSLQNKQGWSPLHEAVCAREEQIAKIILRHYQPLAWAKWCRRMPRLVATMRRMRDFYMEIDFHFESSVIPFISRVAPSDTYKIWKRGSNLRADMTLSGFDGFKIQRADQSILFLGEGSEDGKVKPGSLCIVSHKDKEVLNALDGAGGLPSEAELQQEVETMLRTNILRPGLDVTGAALLPQMNWRKQQRSEMIGPWMAEVYNMHHVVVSVKSRHVPGAIADEEIFSNCKNDDESDEQMDMLTEEGRKQLEAALKMEGSDCADHDTFFHDQNSTLVNDIDSTSHSGGGEQQKERKGWIANWKKKGKNHKHDVEKKDVAPRRSPHVEDKARDLSELQKTPGRVESKKSGTSSDNAHRRKESGKDNEYKKGLRPVLWLSPNFPLQIEELLPLLDILANKVKAIHRLRELLTTKLPTGTFPVKVAIPVVPTVRVLVTFTKFEELQPPSPEEFCTPPSSPESESPQRHSSSSWAHWMTAPYKSANSYFKASPDPNSCSTDLEDPFTIPPNYVWTTPEAKKKKKFQEAGGSVKKKQS
ncbi:hypothetical protein AXF42_Ash000856 [Apostasia shenzhenica]|uniref:Ankyrin repeat domain-containing protein n=1 Tax=Apostasia shenzhenica TaxID=1088818 RepID=A0A2I0AT87_9ASPA|nr:hypothetical protein AXF42_Ash000856 [Apostasia shenzhenica]